MTLNVANRFLPIRMLTGSNDALLAQKKQELPTSFMVTLERADFAFALLS